MANVFLPMATQLKIHFQKYLQKLKKIIGLKPLQNQPMNYPNRLLPQVNFKKIVWSENLKGSFLIHFTDTKDIIDPKTTKLRQVLVVKRTDHLRDYSNNLLGVFLTDDIYWAIQEGDNKEYLIAEWNIGEAVIPPVVPADYKKDTDRGFFF